MHLEITPYLMLGSIIAICIFSIIQCYIYKIEDLKNYSKPSKILFGLLIATIIYSPHSNNRRTPKPSLLSRLQRNH